MAAGSLYALVAPSALKRKHDYSCAPFTSAGKKP